VISRAFCILGPTSVWGLGFLKSDKDVAKTSRESGRRQWQRRGFGRATAYLHVSKQKQGISLHTHREKDRGSMDQDIVPSS
jgi:hypothetical protein